mmetsp:Transcript_23191/g.64393  ORF Transcript_23191/g.64393 Transcript_23191/m.64393 type:complete len:331 (+) Transcript_23191:122-1114(+)
MPAISNVGGSVTSALVILAVAWSIRLVRIAALRSERDRKQRDRQTHRKKGRYAAPISPPSLKLLVGSDPFPHLLIDTREDRSSPLPQELQGAVGIAVRDLEAALLPHKGDWAVRFGSAPPPMDTALVVIGDTSEAMFEAAMAVAACGYQRCLYLSCGLEAYKAEARKAAERKFLSRDATAALLGVGGGAAADVKAAVLDLRRHDERTLYGYIQGTRHIPVHQIPAMLEMSDEECEQTYHFQKPRVSDVLVMQCRTNRRAAWAAQVFADHGYTSCFIYKAGIYGWHLDPAIKSYASYEVDEKPPEPEPFEVETVNLASAVQELAAAGILKA